MGSLEPGAHGVIRWGFAQPVDQQDRIPFPQTGVEEGDALWSRLAAPFIVPVHQGRVCIG